MKRLLDVADVTFDDGEWTGGYQIGAIGCGLAEFVANDCNPVTATMISGVSQAVTARAESGYRSFEVVPFGIFTSFSPHLRCKAGDEISIVEGALSEGSSAGVEYVARYGFPNWGGEVWFQNPSVTHLAPGATAALSLGAALKQFYSKTSSERAMVGMGLQAAIDLGPNLPANALLGDLDIYVSPMFGNSEIFVTSPIKVRLNPIVTITGLTISVNRSNVEATRLATLEFDPCTAVAVY